MGARKRPRRRLTIWQRLIRYLIAIPIVTPISATVILLGGPFWTDAHQRAPETPHLAELERDYAERMRGTPVVIADLPAIHAAHPETGPGIFAGHVRRHLDARLNAAGIYFNALWHAQGDRVAARFQAPNA